LQAVRQRQHALLAWAMGDWSAVVDRLNERRRQAAKSVLEDDIA
jgi:hypothetical protein